MRLTWILVVSFALLGCQGQSQSPQVKPSQSASIQAEVDNPDWERFYNDKDNKRVIEYNEMLKKKEIEIRK